MASLTSVYCSKHLLTVVINVHVKPCTTITTSSCFLRQRRLWLRHRWHPLASHLPLTLSLDGESSVGEGEGKHVKGVHRIARINLAND